MRVGLIADIHGNVPALDAVLAELEAERVDEIVCLGDVPVGPQPCETVERIRKLECPVVLGNWDSYFLNGFPHLGGELGRRLVEIGAWWAERLSGKQLDYMRSFKATVELGDGDARLLAFHGSPRSFEEAILATTPEEELGQMLDGASAAVLAGGHTHFQLVRRLGESLIVNPGSVGLPFSRRAAVMRIAPWAEYGIVTIEDNRLAVDLRRTTFDVEAYVELLRSSGMPHAEWWANLWTAEPDQTLAATRSHETEAVQSTMT
jgi:putative phosphoesterase